MKFCKETHPTNIKLNQVFDLMDKLGISIEVGRQRTIIKDRDIPDKEYEMADSDYYYSPADCGNIVTNFPYGIETILIVHELAE
jgi:hypothetical protein